MNQAPQVKRNLPKLLLLAIVLGALALLAWYINNNASLGVLIEHEQNVREAIAGNPVRSFFIGFGIYFALSLVPGTGGKGIVYGWLFGFWLGVTIVTVGLAVAGMIIFFLSRYLFQEAVERRFPQFVERMNSHIEKEGAFYLLTLRMAHAPYSIVNPVSGASRVSSWVFFWTTVVGLLPANSIWVYVGRRLPSLQELAAQGSGAFIDLPLIAALIGCAFLPLLVRWIIRRTGLPGDEIYVQEIAVDNNAKETP